MIANRPKAMQQTPLYLIGIQRLFRSRLFFRGSHPRSAVAIGRNFRITGIYLAATQSLGRLSRDKLNTAATGFVAIRLVLILESGTHRRVGRSVCPANESHERNHGEGRAS